MPAPPWTASAPAPPIAADRVWSRKRTAALFGGLMLAGLLYNLVLTQGLATVNSATSIPAGAQIGQCFGLGTKRAVACDGRHHFEIFGAAEHPADAEYPSAVIRAMRNTACNQQFEAHTGSSIYLSDYDYQQVFPSEQSWADGDHTVVCALHWDDLAPMGSRFGGWFSP